MINSQLASDTSEDGYHSMACDQFQTHEQILRDQSRVAAYYDAIMNSKHLFENKVVLEVGSGTGILSMFAAKAGAKFAYAVDVCPKLCHLARALIQYNHLQDKIEVINKRIEDIERFEEKIDIILSDWMGYYLFHESLLESVIYARDHFLKLPSRNNDMSPDPIESIVIYPSHAYLYCAPFVDQHVRIESNTMWKNYFDLNLSPILPYIKNYNLNDCVIDTIEPSQLVHDAQLVQSVDIRTIRAEDLIQMRSCCEFDIDNTCVISGMCFWFDCYFSSNNNSSILRSTRLTTSPYSTKTHWKQTLVFLPEDIYPLKGTVIPVNIKLTKSLQNSQHYQISIHVKKMKEAMATSTIVDDEPSSSDLTMRRRQRRRSSTISCDKRIIADTVSLHILHDSSSSNSDDEINSDEHPVPCSCARDRCQLIKTISEKYNEENIV